VFDVSLVTSAEEAEEIVTQWLQKKFGDKLKKTRMRHASLTDSIWNVEVEVNVSSGAFSTAYYLVTLKVDANSGKIVSYTEGQRPKPDS
jgi:hypothetical protein